MLKLLLRTLCLLVICQFANAQTAAEQAQKKFEEADSIWWAQGDYQLALQLFEQSKAEFSDSDSYMALRCDVGIIRCLYYLQNDPELVKRCNLLISQMESIDTEDTLTAHAYYYWGNINFFNYQIDSAVDKLSKALLIFESADSTSRDVLNTSWTLGAAYGAGQQFFSAIDQYERAIKLSDYVKSDADKVPIQYNLARNLGIVKGNLGQFDEAFSLFESCLNLQSEHPEILNENYRAQTLASIGYAHLKVGNLEQAKSYMERSLALNNNPDIQNNLGLVLTDMGLLDEAQAIFEEFLKKSPYESTKAKMYSNLSRIYHLRGDYEQAIKYNKKATDLARKLGDNSLLAIVFANLGAIQFGRKEYESSKELLKQAITMFPEQDNSTLSRLGEAFLKLEKYDSAIFYSEKSVFDDNGDFSYLSTTPSKMTKLIERVQLLAYTYAQYAEKSQEKKHVHKLIKLCEDYHQYLEQFYSTYSNLSSSLNAQSVYTYELGITQSSRLAHDQQTDELLEKAFLLSEWSKVEILSAGQRSEKARSLSHLPESLTTLEKNLKAKENYHTTRMKQLEVSGDSVKALKQKDLLFDVVQEKDSLLSVIRTQYPRYHRLKYQNTSLGVSEVQEKLALNEAFVEYFQGDSSSFVFLITRDQYELIPIDLQNDSLILDIREGFKNMSIDEPFQDFAAKSYEVYEAYLEPVITLLGDQITELIVVPDGNLSYIPFDVLVTEKPNNGTGPSQIPYLLNDYQVHYTYSASLYFNDFNTLSDVNEYLAFAPAYEPPVVDSLLAYDNGLGNFRNQIMPLTYNVEEVDHISTQFKGLEFLGENATERNFKDHVESYGVLHLAMHTILDDKDPMNSKLVFTHSGDSLEDDLLHAFEIYNMRIPSQLTVLSACETGFGKLARGEGALSLARAFAYAGSPSIVMSHWPVDDQTTAQLMRYFYEYLGEGQKKSEALRNAKLSILNNSHSIRAHPFYWGSFVVMGDDNPIDLKDNSLVPPVFIWITLTFLGVIIYVFTRKKRPTDAT